MVAWGFPSQYSTLLETRNRTAFRVRCDTWETYYATLEYYELHGDRYFVAFISGTSLQLAVFPHHSCPTVAAVNENISVLWTARTPIGCFENLLSTGLLQIAQGTKAL